MPIRTQTIDLELLHPFTIARGTKNVSSIVVAELEHGGILGYGESCPNAYYSESTATVAQAIDDVSEWMSGQSPLAYEHLLEDLSQRMGGESRAALSCLDLAVFDWVGKKLGVSVHRLLGVDPALSPQTSLTIGIDTPQRMVEKLREAGDVPIIKVKVGMPGDVEVVRALRRESRAVFRVDANCGWELREAIEKSHELASLGVEFIEQPLPPEQLDAMEEVYAKSALPLVADENSVVAADLPALVGRFHGINIKLVKCGGLRPALRMIHVARALGFRVMLGCMVDSSLSAAAAAQIAPLVDDVDLDGPLLIKNDPFRGLSYIGARPVVSNLPGLGVEPAD